MMMPGMAKKRHVVVEEREKKLREFAETCDLNKIEMNDTKIGIIASGIAYQYAREALGDKASYFKLGLIYPLPVESIKKFAAQVDKLYVIEELDDIFETHLKKHGIKVTGKELFSKIGEYSPNTIREKIRRGRTRRHGFLTRVAAPARTCPAVLHRGIFYG